MPGAKHTAKNLNDVAFPYAYFNDGLFVPGIFGQDADGMKHLSPIEYTGFDIGTNIPLVFRC